MRQRRELPFASDVRGFQRAWSISADFKLLNLIVFACGIAISQMCARSTLHHKCDQRLVEFHDLSVLEIMSEYFFVTVSAISHHRCADLT